MRYRIRVSLGTAALPRVREAGLVFVGPPAAVIERMGSNRGAGADAIRRVPVVPGSTPNDQTDDGYWSCRRMSYRCSSRPRRAAVEKGMRLVRSRMSGP